MSVVAQIEVPAFPLRVLVVGHREEDFFLVRDILDRNRKSLSTELDHVGTLDEARELFRRGAYGLVLFEHEAGDAAAIHLLTELSCGGATVPFILLTEHADEKTVAEIIANGAWDYMDKSQLNGANLLSTIRRTLNFHSVQQQRHFDVLGRRRLRKKRQTLNDETARSPAKSGAGTSAQRRPVNASHPHLSLVGGVESAEKIEEGAFA